MAEQDSDLGGLCTYVLDHYAILSLTAQEMIGTTLKEQDQILKNHVWNPKKSSVKQVTFEAEA